MGVCARSIACVAGLISVTSPHAGQTSCRMLPCISTVRPARVGLTKSDTDEGLEHSALHMPRHQSATRFTSVFRYVQGQLHRYGEADLLASSNAVMLSCQ